MREKKILFLVGPTAVGKTELSLRLAKEFPAEIISADSMQVYRGMDISTDKPSLSVRKKIPHHLMDEISPTREFSVHDWKEEAFRRINIILRKGKLPMVVGGSGLYVRSLLDGLAPHPGESSKIRSALRKEAKEKGLERLYSRLKRVDKKTADKISKSDERRIIRALEVYKISGVPISAWKRKTVSLRELGYDFMVMGLDMEREEVYARIEKRVDSMVKKGLIDEIKALNNERLSKTARQALSYKEISRYLRGEIDLETAKEEIKKNTRRFAKRQLTWFRNDRRIKWILVNKKDTGNAIFRKAALEIRPWVRKRSNG